MNALYLAYLKDCRVVIWSMVKIHNGELYLVLNKCHGEFVSVVNSHKGDLDLGVKYLPWWNFLGFKIRQGELYFRVNIPRVNDVRVERSGGVPSWNQ